MSVSGKTTVQLFWRDRSVLNFAAGVSLHSHTMYSEESLGMVSRYTSRLPYLGPAIRRIHSKYINQNKQAFHFEHAFWTPPLSARQAYRLEEKQINRRLQLPALVSLTDHDDIRAGSQLRVMERFRRAPISTEWTVPFGPTFFHLGIHNLPDCEAPKLFAEMQAYTAKPKPAKLSDLLAWLNGYSNVLVVLNHPLWDEKGIGAQQQMRALKLLLESHRERIHALEVNGIRSWHENKKVISMGRELGIAVLSGGDRHGREPNAILNLSRSTTLEGLVHEVRRERMSHMVVMPHYRVPLKVRILQTMVDALRDYPENPQGRRLWTERIFYRDPESGETVRYCTVWPNGGPAFIHYFVRAINILEWRERALLSSRWHERSRS